MIFIAPRHIDDTQIAVTGTATLLFTLMGTAGSVNPSVVQGYYSADGNAAWLYCATNSFRFAFGDPTANKGALVQTGERRLVVGDLSTLKLIRTGGSNATVDVEIGRASEFESVFGMANTASVTVTADTEFAAAAALNGTWAKTTSSTISGAAVMANDGTNLVLIGGEATNGLDVDVTRLPALVAGTAVIGKVGIDQTTPGTTNAVAVTTINSVAPTFAAVTPTATLTGYQNNLPFAVYNATPTTRTEGQGGTLQADTLGKILSRDASSGLTGAAVPASACYLGVLSGGSNLAGLGSVSAQGDGTSMSTGLAVGAFTFNGSNFDRTRSVTNTLNSTGTGIVASGMVAQFDDTSPQTITENSFGNLRMSANRYLYTEQHYLSGQATGDTQIAGAAGFVHTVTISPLTATPTAGLLTVYDNTAESGTVLYSEWIFATTVGHTVTLDIPASTGIYVGFDGTLANVRCVVSYRLNT